LRPLACDSLPSSREKLRPLKQTGSLAAPRSIPSLKLTSTTWSEMGTRSHPPSPDDRIMDYSSPGSEQEENMEVQLAINMSRSPSPPPAPPPITTLEEDYQSIENSTSCTDFIEELHKLVESLDSYRFDNFIKKLQYHNSVVKIFKNSVDLRERL
ncbi:hypothetical protein TNCV_733061, partial [Trichonephila clavipes]